VKTDAQQDVAGLNFIMKLKPYTYSYSIAESNKLQGKADNTEWAGKHDIELMRFSGFFAQEVEQAAKEAGYTFSGVDRPQDADGMYGLRYAEFTVPLVKAMQEQQLMIEALKEQNRLMMLEIETLKAKVR